MQHNSPTIWQQISPYCTLARYSALAELRNSISIGTTMGVVFVVLLTWSQCSVARASFHTPTIVGYSLSDLATYFIVANVVYLVGAGRWSNVFEREATNGTFEASLVSPGNRMWLIGIQYIPVQLIIGLRAALLSYGCCILAGIPVRLHYDTLLPAIFSLMLGIIAFHLLQCLYCWVSFHGVATKVFTRVSSHLLVIFGGMNTPLELYPASIRSILQYTPFGAMSWAPAHLFAQPSSYTTVARILTVQLLWICVLVLLHIVVSAREHRILQTRGI